MHTFGISADVVAYATLTYAMNTSSVNGVSGKGSFKLEEPLEPLATEAVAA